MSAIEYRNRRGQKRYAAKNDLTGEVWVHTEGVYYWGLPSAMWRIARIEPVLYRWKWRAERKARKKMESQQRFMDEKFEPVNVEKALSRFKAQEGYYGDED